MNVDNQMNLKTGPSEKVHDSVHTHASMLDFQDRVGGLTFNCERWANLRQTSVSDFAADWAGDSNEWRVQIIDDPKLCRVAGPMVLMRQTLFQRMSRTLRELLEGSTALSAKIEDIAELTELFYSLREQGVGPQGLLKVSEINFSKCRSLSMGSSHLPDLQEAGRYQPSPEEMAEFQAEEEGESCGDPGSR